MFSIFVKLFVLGYASLFLQISSQRELTSLFSFYHIFSLQVQYKYETMEFNLVSPYQLNITEGLKIIEEKNLYIDISEC